MRTIQFRLSRAIRPAAGAFLFVLALALAIGAPAAATPDSCIAHSNGVITCMAGNSDTNGHRTCSLLTCRD